MYIHAKYICISLTTMLPLKFGQDNGKQWADLEFFFSKIYPSLAGQNNKFKFVKQKKFILKSIVLQENLIVKGS